MRNGRGCRSQAGTGAEVRVAPKLRTRRGGPRLGQHANTLKHTGKTTLEVFDGTLLERHSCTRALEPVLAHVTREDEEHDRDRIARGRCDWQEIVGHNNSACGAVSFGEAGQAHGLLVNESGRAPGTQPGSIIISTRLCLDPLRGGTGVALTRSSASLSASLKTAFLAYARACARVRGGPNSRGGVKAVAPRTATRRRATTVFMTVSGGGALLFGIVVSLCNQARVSSTTFGDFFFCLD